MTAILLPVFQRLYIQSSWFSLMLWILCEKFKGGNLPQKKEILKFRAKAFLPSKEWEIDQDAANSLRLEGVVKHLLEFLCNFFPHYGTKFSPNYHKGTNMLNFSTNFPEFWCFLLASKWRLPWIYIILLSYTAVCSDVSNRLTGIFLTYFHLSERIETKTSVFDATSYTPGRLML